MRWNKIRRELKSYFNLDKDKTSGEKICYPDEPYKLTDELIYTIAENEDEYDEAYGEGAYYLLKNHGYLKDILFFYWIVPMVSSCQGVCLIDMEPDRNYFCVKDDDGRFDVIAAFRPKNSRIIFNRIVLDRFKKYDLIGDIPSYVTYSDDRFFDRETIKEGFFIWLREYGDDLYGFPETLEKYVSCLDKVEISKNGSKIISEDQVKILLDHYLDDNLNTG